MRLFPTMLALLILSSCGGKNADYQVIEKKVQPDSRTMSEDKASNLLKAPEDFNKTIELIRNDRKPDFSWLAFWNGINHLNIIKSLNADQLKVLLQLSEESCKEEDIKSFTILSLKEKERIKPEAQDLFLKQEVTLYQTCQKVPDIELSSKILKHAQSPQTPRWGWTCLHRTRSPPRSPRQREQRSSACAWSTLQPVRCPSARLQWI